MSWCQVHNGNGDICHDSIIIFNRLYRSLCGCTQQPCWIFQPTLVLVICLMYSQFMLLVMGILKATLVGTVWWHCSFSLFSGPWLSSYLSQCHLNMKTLGTCDVRGGSWDSEPLGLVSHVVKCDAAISRDILTRVCLLSKLVVLLLLWWRCSILFWEFGKLLWIQIVSS